MRGFVVALVSCALAVAAPQPPKGKDKPTDLDAIQGVWRPEKFEGEDGPTADELANLRLTIGKGTITIALRGVEREKPQQFKLDPSAKPKTIDVTAADETAFGIYELDGDTLRICLGDGPKVARPTEFKAGKRVGLMTLKRVKDK
jgi:uncharacterized protein (TIGR03067 family)